jgi:hypothetical protein
MSSDGQGLRLGGEGAKGRVACFVVNQNESTLKKALRNSNLKSAYDEYTVKFRVSTIHTFFSFEMLLDLVTFNMVLCTLS